MSDLISRQAAIDAVMNTEPVFDGGGKTYQATADVISALTGLPSAHPLNPCETCLHKGKGWGEDPCDGCTGTESKYEPDNGWIPVSERLPNCNGCYLVWRPHFFGGEIGMPSICYFDGSNTWHDSYGVDFERILHSDDVVAWMPLPDPYKEEER